MKRQYLEREGGGKYIEAESLRNCVDNCEEMLLEILWLEQREGENSFVDFRITREEERKSRLVRFVITVWPDVGTNVAQIIQKVAQNCGHGSF